MELGPLLINITLKPFTCKNNHIIIDKHPLKISLYKIQQRVNLNVSINNYKLKYTTSKKYFQTSYFLILKFSIFFLFSILNAYLFNSFVYLFQSTLFYLYSWTEFQYIFFKNTLSIIESTGMVWFKLFTLNVTCNLHIKIINLLYLIIIQKWNEDLSKQSHTQPPPLSLSLNGSIKKSELNGQTTEIKSMIPWFLDVALDVKKIYKWIFFDTLPLVN